MGDSLPVWTHLLPVIKFGWFWRLKFPVLVKFCGFNQVSNIMDARSSFGSPFSNIQNKQNALNERLSTATPMQGWGAPAVGFSPYTCNFRPQRSPRDCNTSPIHGNYQQRSPRTQQNIFKHPSPNGPRTFRSPYNYLPFFSSWVGAKIQRHTQQQRSWQKIL